MADTWKLTDEHLDALRVSGLWGVRYDEDGKSHEGFQWAPLGAWTEAPDWDPTPVCGGGLHLQHGASVGYTQQGLLTLVEIEGPVVPLGDKVKVRQARRLATGQAALDALTTLGAGGLRWALRIGAGQHLQPQATTVGDVWVYGGGTLSLPQATP